MTIGGATTILTRLKKSTYYSPAEYRRKYGTGAFRFGTPAPVQRYYLIEALTKAIGEATQSQTTGGVPSSMVGSSTSAVPKPIKAGCLITEVFT